MCRGCVEGSECAGCAETCVSVWGGKYIGCVWRGECVGVWSVGCVRGEGSCVVCRVCVDGSVGCVWMGV